MERKEYERRLEYSTIHNGAMVQLRLKMRDNDSGTMKKGSILLCIILFVGAVAMYSTFTVMRPIVGDLMQEEDTFVMVRDDTSEREAEAEAVT
jgi:hypothetical protein